MRCLRTLSTSLAQGVVARVRGHEGLVEVAAALGRAPLHQLEVVRREHAPRITPRRSRAFFRGWRFTRTRLRPLGDELGLEQDRRGPRAPLRPDHGPIGAPADQGVGRRTPERPEGRQPAYGLEQVGLALARCRPSSAVSPGASSTSASG